MEKPRWAPLILSGAFPREFADLLAILIITLTSLESLISGQITGNLQIRSVAPLLAVPLACTLASLSNTGSKVKEELALFAYGGSGWEVLARYFLRGLTCTLLALSPVLVYDIILRGSGFGLQSLLPLIASTVGGVCYAAPSYRRLRSEKLAAHYKA